MMSYTPEEQKLHNPIQNFVESLDALSAAMRARLDNPEEWTEAHRLDLLPYLSQFDELKMRLRQLQKKTP